MTPGVFIACAAYCGIGMAWTAFLNRHGLSEESERLVKRVEDAMEGEGEHIRPMIRLGAAIGRFVTIALWPIPISIAVIHAWKLIRDQRRQQEGSDQ